MHFIYPSKTVLLTFFNNRRDPATTVVALFGGKRGEVTLQSFRRLKDERLNEELMQFGFWYVVKLQYVSILTSQIGFFMRLLFESKLHFGIL